MKVWGPYTAKDGRQRMVIKTASGKKTTISYPKYLMQRRLGVNLSPNEVVHHKDENPLNNEERNLEVKTRATHSSDHHAPTEWVSFVCPQCGCEAVKKAKHVRSNRRQGKAGPFCSRRCAGLWSTSP